MLRPSRLLQPDNPVVVRGWSLWVPPPLNRLGKPDWINANDRPHWSGKAKQTSAWRQQACVAIQKSGVPSLSQAWVQAIFSFGTSRKRDVHNLFPTIKASIDGFTDAGLWEDDRDGILTGPDLRRSHSDAKGQPVGIEFRIFEVIDGN